MSLLQSFPNPNFEFLNPKSFGIWGLLLGISIIWIAFREWNLSKKNKTDENSSKEENNFLKEAILIKERQENHVKVLEQNNLKLQDISDELKNVSININNFLKLNDTDHEQIEHLISQLQNVNDERVDELKEILNSYNRTMNELTLTLQKIKFVLKNNLDDGD